MIKQTIFLCCICIFLLSADSIRIIDGDTIALNGVKYRLLGIDCPETSNNKRLKTQLDILGWTDKDKDKLIELGKQARKQMAELVDMGGLILFDYDPYYQSEDLYGRQLVYLYVQDETDMDNRMMVNLVMLSNGLAWPYRWEKLHYTKEFKHAIVVAYKKKIGIYKYWGNQKVNQ